MSKDYCLKSSCRVVTNTGDDCFVGIRSENNHVDVCFPVGFHLSETEEGLRNDVKLLLSTLSRGTTVLDGSIPIVTMQTDNKCGFPFADYLEVLDYYFFAWILCRKRNKLSQKLVVAKLIGKGQSNALLHTRKLTTASSISISLHVRPL